jgi:putative ABC transport system substrate-binding protein
MNRRRFIGASAAIIAVPRTTRAQESVRTRRLALLGFTVPAHALTEATSRELREFFGELRRLGYQEGKNLVVERRSIEGDVTRSPVLAREIVALRPDVILTYENRLTAALQAATKTIPIVTIVADPVHFGFAASLARPGGNITGFTIDGGAQILGKHFALLREVVPAQSKVGYLTAREFWEGKVGTDWREAVGRSGLAAVSAALEYPVSEAEYRHVFARMARDRPDFLYIGGISENVMYRQLIANLAADVRLPTFCPLRALAQAGALMAYSAKVGDLMRGAAGYVARILSGANPAELPFQQPTTFELVVNLKTAKRLGLELSPSLLLQADEIIE